MNRGYATEREIFLLKASFFCYTVSSDREKRLFMLYQITDGTVRAGGNVILSHVNFEIKGNALRKIVKKIIYDRQNGEFKVIYYV